jgi:DNA polymerase III subunit epsilon
VNLWSALRGRPAFDDARWVVVDVETTGLDPARDRLLAIAGVAVVMHDDNPRVELGDSFEVVLRHDQGAVDKSNILLHGIGVGAQRGGLEPTIALEAFEQWLGGSPLIAFHAAFDESVIQRALQAVLGRRLRNPWVDLAPIAEVANPKVPARSLDEWLAHFGITCAVRHQAAADTLATAELLLRLWPAILSQGAPGGFRGLRQLAAQWKWLRSG